MSSRFRHGVVVLLGAAACAVAVCPAWALDPRLVPHFSSAGATPVFTAAPARPGFAAVFENAESSGSGGSSGSLGPSPLVAGLMSAILPGSGQLALGAKRGWLYLGIETAGWFGWWALRASGDQARRDARGFADSYWDLDRFSANPSNCGAAGSNNVDQDKALIEDQYDHSRDDYYKSLEEAAFACGWETQTRRGEYLGMMDDADGLYGAAKGFTAALFLNHFVSAIDAAKTAGGRRRQSGQGMNLEFYPGAKGALGVRVEMRRSF